MGQLNDLSMTFDDAERRGVKGEPVGMPSRMDSVVIPQQFGGERARHRPAKPQRFGIELLDGETDSGKRSFGPCCDKIDDRFVDVHLAVGGELHDQRPE